MNQPPTTAAPHVSSPVADAIRSWPADRPCAAVVACDPRGRTRYSLLAEPVETFACGTFDRASVLIRERQRASTDDGSPFGPGWVVSIDYAAGYEIEPASCVREPCIHRPAVMLARIESGTIHDNRTDSWTAFGGHTPERIQPVYTADSSAGFTLGPPLGLDRRRAYERAVARAVELIHAGDVFQVNLTHRLAAAFEGSPRALFAALAHRLAPWHACYLETSTGAIASASPECFLELDRARRATSRPMKGTRPAHDDSLDASPKDAAELAMIVDLMRNDLGRVCRPGSVRVDDPRSFETHGSQTSPHVRQGVATVSGTLRSGLDALDLIRAAFPPGSVTGAPKIRAMQIIEELEPSLGFDAALPARGPYCGAVGFIGDDGTLSLSVAIRTAIIEGTACHYPVGAGIVADSDPHAEWLETIVKAGPFLELCGGAGR